ncbi:MAG TPA: hypothetical protein VL137_16060 [Polyangiaceae bacterium]|nr:hypothetical protein [Polyangiaceae bacterium]
MAGEEATLRVLDLLRRELRAASVYLEFGGTPRLEPTVVSQALDEHWRVVAVFTEPAPADTRERLASLLAAFSNTRPSLTPVARAIGRPPAERRLDEELVRLQDLIGAKVSLIIDESSPIIWGASALREHRVDVDFLQALAAAASPIDSALKDLAIHLGASDSPQARTPLDPELERLRASSHPLSADEWYLCLLAALATAPFRSRRQKEARARRVVQPPPIGYVAQPLASQYVLLFVFDEPFSQLHAEATAVHSVPYLEKLIGELPPIDPEGGAKAVRKANLKLV